ncbi:MAG TPA: hypothetical protein VGM34_02875 [Chlamydiales bacterium]|jgi:hypothetical protein
MNRSIFLAPLLLSSILFAQTAPAELPPAPAVTAELVTPATPLAAETPASVVQSADVQFNDKREESDMEALRRWLQDKRFVSLKEIGGDLSISGEVRTEAQFFNEKSKAQGSSEYIKQRGENSATGKPSLAWDVEFNLMMDYRTDRTWAAVKVEFDNDMGIRSGTVSKVRLEKAYLGGRLLPGDTFTWDAEIGRRNLFNVFDSRIEFSALFDGVLTRFGKAFDQIGDFYANIGAFLVNDNWNHYGEVMEIGALRVANVGLNLKYSIINWYKPLPQSEVPQRWRFLVNQFLASYQFYPEWIGKRLIKFYGAGLINVLAQDVVQTGMTKQNVGWYTGVSIGLVKKAGDFAIDANYQWVQGQAVPDVDAAGIGRGNAAGVGFYTTNINGSGAPTTQETAQGNGNFKGFEVDVLYALTNNITIEQNFKFSVPLNKTIGPDFRYKQWELEFIYAF